MLAAYVTGPVVPFGATIFFCVVSVTFLFAEKLAKVESICYVLDESLFTVLDASIPLK